MKIQLIKVHKVKALFVSFVILKRTITIGRSCFISWPNNRQQRVIADSFPKVPLSIFIFPPPFLVFFYFFPYVFEGDNQTSALSEHDVDWPSSLTLMNVVVHT